MIKTDPQEGDIVDPGYCFIVDRVTGEEVAFRTVGYDDGALISIHRMPLSEWRESYIGKRHAEFKKREAARLIKERIDNV